MIVFWRAKHFVMLALLALCCTLAPAWANACDCPPQTVMVCERPCGECCETKPLPVQLGQQIPVTLRPVFQAAHPDSNVNWIYILPSRLEFPAETVVTLAGVTYRDTPELPPRSRWGPSFACRAPPVVATPSVPSERREM